MHANATDPIRLGIATDITGPIAPSGNACWQTAQLVAEEINAAGGINGRQVRLFLEDTAPDLKVAVRHVRKLMQEREVTVILGGITSAMRRPSKPRSSTAARRCTSTRSCMRASNAPSACSTPARRRRSNATS